MFDKVKNVKTRLCTAFFFLTVYLLFDMESSIIWNRAWPGQHVLSMSSEIRGVIIIQSRNRVPMHTQTDCNQFS